ncbi:MAG: hypothetical protein O2816_14000 [Planctomycetota bacterium]|nr:hypothetical protein [Planctomycetota bacterium]
MVEVGDWQLLEVTWQLRIDEVGQRGFRLFLHGYEAAASPHPAIPELPISGESVILGNYEEPLEGWNQHEFVVQRRKLPPAATWIRLEWRILSPLGEADRDAGAFAFDEVVIRSKGS